MRYASFLLLAALAFGQPKPAPQKNNERGLKVEKLDEPLPAPKAQAIPRSYAVIVGVTTSMITVPTGVFSMVISFCFQLSEPGATPGQTFTV